MDKQQAAEANVEPEFTGLIPVSRLEELEFSAMARRLIGLALELTRGDFQSVLGTRSLLAALFDPRLSRTTGAVNWFRAAVGDRIERWSKDSRPNDANRARQAAPSTVKALSQNFSSVLELASSTARDTTSAREIHSRHLIAALLLYTPPEPTAAHKILRELGCEPAALRQPFLESILAWGRDDGQAWRRVLGSSERGAVQDARPTWDLPRVSNDRVAGFIAPDRDLLDASRPALRFAKLLAAKDVKPPIALGLFGNWGSGKTFFMGLMQSHVKSLADGNDRDYVRRAAQIDFNAWHYQDTNLWASIAVRIFDGLVKELARDVGDGTAPDPADIETKRRELNQKIASSKDRKAEAVAQREQALTRRAEKSRELEGKVAERERRVAQSSELQAKAAWQVLANDPEVRALKKSLKELAGRLGLSHQLDAVTDILQLKDELRSLTGRGHALVAAVSARFQRGRVVSTVAWLAFLVVAVTGVGWLVQFLPTLWKDQKAPPGAAILAQVTAFVSWITAWASREVRGAAKAVDEAARLDAKIQSKAQEMSAASGSAGQEATLRTQIANLDRDIRGAAEELREADRQIAEATAEVERINQGGLVYDFLQERRTSTKYASQLGLVSTIRQDLDSLGKLLGNLAKEGTRPIERVILYVDDLDRCQPAKVVEVLQAVHLLLAFDIFHVVVGVDARWLRRSLEETYASERTATLPEEFSAHDYLEKIFQIPYALAPLQENAFNSLIDGMIVTRTEWALAQDAGAHVQPLATDAARPAATAGAGGPATTNGASPPSKPPLSRSAAPVVFFEDHEETFIKALHEFIDRPRLAGRFVNIYRLLRARAADEQEDASFAASSQSIEYRVALLLLAINVGHPRVAGHLFRDIGRAKESSWSAFLGAERKRADVEGELRAGYDRLLGMLDALTVEMPDDLAWYQRWAQRVICFSFDLPSELPMR